ncbi:hypothetical protein Golomagni_06220 [Golovinomyces magnicellulatus]|nr:hypothetical protein Golomagni_06220 [Golovinomyces magnicellulatus]
MATYETAQTQYISVNDVRFAYRRLGSTVGTPLVMFMHFRGTMDHWDPTLINPIAARRPVLLIDNAGIGRSSGTIPPSFAQWAAHYMSVVQALGIPHVDVAGFSMGGCVAQMAALNYPRVVRRLILLGTTPSIGDGVVRADLGPFNQLRAASSHQEQEAAFLSSFFRDSPASQAAGKAAWHRISHSRSDPVDHVPAAGAKRQGIAFANFMNPKLATEASYNRFNELQLPVLIANGSDDLLLPTENSILMYNKLRHANAQLHLFPNSGHGFLYQYAKDLSKLINDFLDRSAPPSSRL